MITSRRGGLGTMEIRNLSRAHIQRMCFLISMIGIVFVLILGGLGLFDDVVEKWFCFDGLLKKCVLERKMECGLRVDDSSCLVEGCV